MNSVPASVHSRSVFTAALGRAVLTGTLLILTSVAAHGIAAYRQAEDDQRRNLESWVRQGATQLADLKPPPPASGGPAAETPGNYVLEPFRRWAWSVLQEDDLVAAVLLDPEGRTVVTVPQDLPLEPEPSAARQGPGTSIGVVTRSVAGRSGSLWRVTARTRSEGGPAAGHGVVLYAWHRLPLGAVGRSAGVVAAVMLGAGGVLLAWYGRWVARHVQRPLRLLAQAAEDRGPPSGPPLPVERRDEVGALARALEQLINLSNRSEDRLERLERSVDSRVLDQTRQVNAMLLQAEQAVWQDPLTRLGNRRLLEDRLERVFDAQRRTGRDLCIVMLDLDNFKHLNDTRGHAAGDEMIRFLGELLRGSLRPTDIAVRYGGDEFALILLDTTPDQAAAIAERLLRLFGQRAALLHLERPVSLSAGIASLLRDRPGSGHQLLKLADQALYHAKSAGRNRLYVRA